MLSEKEKNRGVKPQKMDAAGCLRFSSTLRLLKDRVAE